MLQPADQTIPSPHPIWQNQRTVTTQMLDNTMIGDRTTMMTMIERDLVRSVVEGAAQQGLVVDVPTVTWTCHVTGRARGADDGQGGRSQVTGL